MAAGYVSVVVDMETCLYVPRPKSVLSQTNTRQMRKPTSPVPRSAISGRTSRDGDESGADDGVGIWRRADDKRACSLRVVKEKDEVGRRCILVYMTGTNPEMGRECDENPRHWHWG